MVIELLSEQAQIKLVDELIELTKEHLENKVPLQGIMTSEELQRRLNISASGMRNLMADGLPSHKFPNSRRLYFFENEVMDFMQ